MSSMKRVGKFYIEKDWIDNSQSELVEMFYQLKIIVIRAEYIFHRRCMEYIAYSPSFREVNPREDMPIYKMVSSDTKGNSGEPVITYTAKEEV